ncbi:MAG TPA: DUF4190 domain-containing protein [Candidatus Saccharimonadales bacterium]|jgi:type IV pilus assembly protein PilA|nr:DUF4190 domain-containing protein [Candidatus Saccharimonadales bacterium]
MFCHQCGSNVIDGARFCPQCGTQFASTPASAAPPRPAPEGAATPLAPPAVAQGPYVPPPAQPACPGVQQTDGKAIGSLVCGILSVTILWFLAAIPAVILGHMSRSEIKKSMGRLQGEGMALAGLIMGYISVAALPFLLIIAAIAIPNLIRARMAANEAAAAQTVRTVITNQLTYNTKFPESGYARDLATLGPGQGGICAGEGTAKNACLIDSTLGGSQCTGGTWCARDGYRYIVVGEGGPPATDFVVTSTPAGDEIGMKSFCGTGDGIVRIHTGMVAAPLTVAECSTWLAL